jgi:hypothetical protein
VDVYWWNENHFQQLSEEQWNYQATTLGTIPFQLKNYYEKIKPEKQSYLNCQTNFVFHLLTVWWMISI